MLAYAVSMEYESVGGLDGGVVEFRYGIPGNEESAQRALAWAIRFDPTKERRIPRWSADSHQDPNPIDQRQTQKY